MGIPGVAAAVLLPLAFGGGGDSAASAFVAACVGFGAAWVAFIAYDVGYLARESRPVTATTARRGTVFPHLQLTQNGGLLGLGGMF